MLSRSIINNKQVLVPIVGAVGAVGAIGLYQYYSTKNQINNDTGKTFTNPNEWIDLTLKESINVGSNSKN